MVTMSRLNRDFQWAIRDKQSLLRARFLLFLSLCFSLFLSLCFALSFFLSVCLSHSLLLCFLCVSISFYPIFLSFFLSLTLSFSLQYYIALCTTFIHCPLFHAILVFYLCRLGVFLMQSPPLPFSWCTYKPSLENLARE